MTTLSFFYFFFIILCALRECHNTPHMSVLGFFFSSAARNATRTSRCFPASSSIIARERSSGGFFSAATADHQRFATDSAIPRRIHTSDTSPAASAEPSSTFSASAPFATTAMSQYQDNNNNDNSDIVRGPSPGPGRSAYVIFNNVVSTVGWPTGKTPGDTVTTQTQLALKCLDERLTAAGTNRSRIIEVTVFLASVAEDKEAMDAVWAEWCPQGCGVSRVILGAELAQGVKVFFKVTAAMPLVAAETTR